jgi:hypothetical protein
MLHERHIDGKKKNGRHAGTILSSVRAANSGAEATDGGENANVKRPLGSIEQLYRSGSAIGWC